MSVALVVLVAAVVGFTLQYLNSAGGPDLVPKAIAEGDDLDRPTVIPPDPNIVTTTIPPANTEVPTTDENGELAPTTAPTTALPDPDEVKEPGTRTPGTITGVVEGDTVLVDDGADVRRVRLVGIDAPDDDQCYAGEATAYLQTLIGTDVIMLVDITDVDDFSRLQRHVFIDDGSESSINEAMVRQGLAESVPTAPNLARKDQIEAAEAEARSASLGFWGECGGAP